MLAMMLNASVASARKYPVRRSTGQPTTSAIATEIAAPTTKPAMFG